MSIAPFLMNEGRTVVCLPITDSLPHASTARRSSFAGPPSRTKGESLHATSHHLSKFFIMALYPASAALLDAMSLLEALPWPLTRKES